MINGSLKNATSLNLDKDFLDGFGISARNDILANIKSHMLILKKKHGVAKKTFNVLKTLISDIEQAEYKEDFIVKDAGDVFHTPRFKMEIPEIPNSKDEIKIVVGWNYVAVPTGPGKVMIVPMATFSADANTPAKLLKQKFNEKLKEKPLIVADQK